MTTRRTYLVRITATISALTAAVFGSGGFARTEADREFDLQIAADDNALLALEPSGVDSAVVGTTDDGRQLLQFDADSVGLGPQSTATVGLFDSIDYDVPTALVQEAFLIRNNTSAAINISLGVDSGNGDAKLKFVLTHSDPEPSSTVSIPSDAEVATDDIDAEINNVVTDGVVYGAAIVRTGDTTDVDANVTLSATRSDSA